MRKQNVQKEWRLQASPHTLIFPPLNPRQGQLCFRPLTKSQTDWWPLSCKWKGWLTSKQCSNCTSWSLEQGQPRPTANSSIHSKPLGGIFALVLNYCLPASDKTSSKPNDVPWHLSSSLAWHSVFSQCSSRTPRIFPSVCLFFFLLLLFVCFPSMCGRSLDFQGKLRAVVPAGATLSSLPEASWAFCERMGGEGVFLCPWLEKLYWFFHLRQSPEAVDWKFCYNNWVILKFC